MLKVDGVFKTYKSPEMFATKKQEILKNVFLIVNELECVGIIGESGSGKSTLGRIILGIEKPDKGNVSFLGEDIRKRKSFLGKISVVFQDYTSSINPRHTVSETIEEPLRFLGMDSSYSVLTALLKHVGLDETYMDKYPHELSGGEAQRVCIARAISTRPKFLLLDEAISSLDVSIQVRILDLLKDLKRTFNMSYLFITHDIQAATYICDRIIFFNEGSVVEEVKVDELMHVKEEYSKKLLNAVITV